MTANDSPTAIGGKEEQLTAKQEQLIMLLVAGVAIVTAAKNTGIAEITAHRWLKLPHVQQAYKAAQRVLFDESLSLLMAGVADAIEGIQHIAKDSEVADNVRLRAYQIWLEQALAVHKISTLEQEIAELRSLLEAKDL